MCIHSCCYIAQPEGATSWIMVYGLIIPGYYNLMKTENVWNGEKEKEFLININNRGYIPPICFLLIKTTLPPRNFQLSTKNNVRTSLKHLFNCLKEKLLTGKGLFLESAPVFSNNYRVSLTTLNELGVERNVLKIGDNLCLLFHFEFRLEG